jgi:hypothetical protein
MELVSKYMSQKRLITRKVSGWTRHYTNTITDELDTFLLDECKMAIQYSGGTYLDGYIENDHMSIRFPGATRGTLIFSLEGIITDIYLFDDDSAQSIQCYKQEAYGAVKKYIGSKLIFV